MNARNMIQASNATCGNLEVEQSCVLLKSETDIMVHFKYQSHECEKCDLVEEKLLHPYHTEKAILKFASFGTVWEVKDNMNKTVCPKDLTYFNEGSSYSLFIDESGCRLEEEKSSSTFTPLIVACAVYVLLGLLWVGCKYLYRKKVWEALLKSRSSLDVSTELAAAYSSSSTNEDHKPVQSRQRLRSLDTVRGIAIVVMIFVNYGGGKYWFFDHTVWNGLTIADLVFPWFIWMMGMSMALSLRSLLRKATPRHTIFLKIIKRSIILFALGIMLNTYCLDVNLKNLRISGVLQRFSVSYFVVATIHLFFAKPEDTHQVEGELVQTHLLHGEWSGYDLFYSSQYSSFRDLFIYWMEWLIMIIILVIHILLTFLVHDPKCPVGYLGPGGLHDEGKYSLCTGGAAGYIDRQILGPNHLYQEPGIKVIYHNKLPYDPEGILGYLTSIFLVYLGLQAGKILLTYPLPKARIIRWLSWSLILGILSMILSKVSKNDGWIPINKNLWSVSFIFATGSLAFLLMTICYFVIDVQKWWTGAPFFYSGMNSILLYVGHSMTHKMLPWRWQISSNHSDILAMNLWATSLWVMISVWAYHVNFFVTV